MAAIAAVEPQERVKLDAASEAEDKPEVVPLVALCR